jgi:hypothetical protein
MGEGWVGVLPEQLFGNRRMHAFEVRLYLGVPEPQNSVALTLKDAGPFCLLRRRPVVLATVDLHNQACIVANEIDNIGPERHLPPKSMPSDLTRPQDCPDASLGIGHGTS